MRSLPDTSVIAIAVALFSAFTIVATSGCGGSGADTVGSDIAMIEAPTYANFGDGFLRNWCRGCHSSALLEGERNGAPLGINFNAHEDALGLRERILARATGEDPTMPPAGGPGAEEIERLAEWLEAGAP